MSFSSGPSKIYQDINDVASVSEKEQNAENLKKCEELLSNIESGFIAIMKDLLKKGGEPLINYLKALFECSICKGLITSAVSRQCLHTFCSDCLTQWAVKSADCPVCRNGLILHMKNPVIDEVVKLLVDLSFTEKEKEDRINEIKQRSARSSQFHAISKSPQGGQVHKLNPDPSVPGRTTCAKMTQSLLSEMFTQFQFRCYGDENICDFILDLHVEMYNSDCESLAVVYNRIPASVLASSIYE